MAFSSPHPQETRESVENLLRETGLSMRAIAARTGIPGATVRFWNAKAAIRPSRRAAGSGAAGREARSPLGRGADLWTWTERRRRAMARLLDRDDVDPGDVAQALGLRRRDAGRLRPAFGLAADRPQPGSGERSGPDLAGLDARLRAHIARQIAAFDRRLRGADATLDSAKILRDLGGLKRLLEDLEAAARQRHSDGDADGGAPQDLAALRDRLARRIEAFAGRPDPAVAGEPGP